ncbi:MAG: hypothetical protein HKN23_20660 [Verrucomicrobiales bacterium]|nr:hypothetical protein [Verrucomicrobiales bacterium]
MTVSRAIWIGMLTAALSCGQEESGELPVLVRSFAEVEKPAPPFENGKFEPKPGETIAFLGGTNTFNLQRNGDLEMHLHLAWSDHDLKIRNLGWQGDTIFYQARPRFFWTKTGDPQPGSTPDIRKKTEPGIVFIQFGKMESLEGESALPKFSAAYAELLELLRAKKTSRIVLLGPTPFFPTGPAADLAESRNTVLAKFSTEMAKLAADRDLLFVDVFGAMKEDPNASTNGVHLTDAGHAQLAEIVAEQLGFPDSTASSDIDPIRVAIQRKSKLWQQFYHPTNWAFLFGDRQHVPASRHHVDTEKRWFIDEVNSLPSLISETEADIHRYAREAAK